MKIKENIQKFRKRLTKNPQRIILGVFFMFLGLIGGLLPILPGWLFFIIGIAILFEESIIERIKKERTKRNLKKEIKRKNKKKTG